ncbi:MAG: relaxase MobL [Actinomycetota bacterium]|nr:relaxase MobL [Actinomycetota bacterium]
MIAKVVSTGGGGGSGLAGYISERGRDESLEGPEPRPLFTSWRGEDRDEMSVAEANGHLAGDADRIPEKDELLHLIVSLTEKEFEALGDTNADRAERLKGAIRDGMRELEREVGVEDLRYAAGIHLNTENPHVHIAVQKEAPVPDSETTAAIERLPRSFFPDRPSVGRETSQAPAREVPGPGGKTLVTIFERAVEAREAPVRMVQFYAQGSRTLETRTLLSDGERQPTEAERRVGRWLILESTPAGDLSPHERRDRQALTAFVRTLDDKARSDGRARSAAFIERDRLRDLIRHERVTPLDANGAAREPYARRDAPTADVVPDQERHVPLGERDPGPLDVLGKEVSLRLTVEHLAWRLEVAERTRDSRRVQVSDPAHGGIERQLSAHDIRIRAESAARRATDAGEPATASDRTLLRERELQRALDPHQDTLEQIDKKHRGQLAHLAKELASARRAMGAVVPDAQRVRSALRAAGAEAKPILDSKEIDRLQGEAIDRGDAKALRYLERLRPDGSRTSEDIARLLGRSIVAQAEERLAEWRVHEFEGSRHLKQYEVDGNKYSLASVEKSRRVAERERAFYEARAEGLRARLDRAKTWTSHGVMTVWKRDDMEDRERAFRERATMLERETERFEILRVAVSDRIAEDRNGLGQKVAKTRDLSITLETIATAERSRLATQGRETPHPAFAGRELRRLEELASDLRDPRLLTVADEARARDPRTSDVERAARTQGRAIAATVELEIARRNESAHHDRVNHLPQLYRDSHGVDRVATISDVAPKGLWSHITKGALQGSEERKVRADVYGAEATARDRLRHETRDASRFAEAARNAADAASARLRSEGRDAPKPLFTHRETARIERFAESAPDPNVRAEFRALVVEALKEGRVREPRPDATMQDTQRLPHARSRGGTAEQPEPALAARDHPAERSGLARAQLERAISSERSPGDIPARTPSRAAATERTHDYGRGR